MEIFAFHPGLNKWVEIGNSGMFRPEMLLPMGLPGKFYIDLNQILIFKWAFLIKKSSGLIKILLYKLNLNSFQQLNSNLQRMSM